MKPRRQTQYKVFISILVFFLLACNALFSVGLPTPTPSAAIESATETPSQQVTLVSIPFHETDPGSNFPAYTLSAQTPQLTGSDDPRVQAMNQRINDLITREVGMWRQSFQQIAVTSNSTGSSLDVTYTLISQIGDLWSFKFDFSFYADAAAHPGLNSITMNYDLGRGRELMLSDLFLPDSNYLETISRYCEGELRKQPYSDSFFLEGTQPTLENYRNWNITPEGLVITFDEYQVAPYAAGPQKVLVPYSELISLINPQGPLAEFVR